MKMIERHKRIQLEGDLNILKAQNLKPNYSSLARKYNVSRKTVAKYYKGEHKKENNAQRTSKLDAYYEEIKQKCETSDTTKQALFKFFQAKYGKELFSSYSTFAHYLARKNITFNKKPQAHVRYETPPGKQLQVDFKEDLDMYLTTGEVIHYHLFVATLGYSRMHYFIYSQTKTTEDFLRCLIEVLNRMDGVPKEILTDNMSAVVNIQKNKKTKRAIIKTFEKDTGIQIKLCRTRTPQTKGKVESANRFAEWLTPYQNELESEQELIDLIEELNREVNNQVNQCTNLPPVLLMKKEKEYLNPLPNKLLMESYMTNALTLTVPTTQLVRFEGKEYSTPPTYIGKRVKLIPCGNKLYIYSNTSLICTHEISEKKINYRKEDYIAGIKPTWERTSKENDIEARALENLKLLEQFEDFER